MWQRVRAQDRKPTDLGLASVFCCCLFFSSKKDGFNESKMDIVSKMPNCIHIFLTSLKSIWICNIQITLRHTFWAIIFVMFFSKNCHCCWVKPWQTLAASMVPLFISLAWSLVVMAGGECLDTSMLQTQLLVYKRTPMLHPWEVNNYVMVPWPAKNKLLCLGFCLLRSEKFEICGWYISCFCSGEKSVLHDRHPWLVQMIIMYLCSYSHYLGSSSFLLVHCGPACLMVWWRILVMPLRRTSDDDEEVD